MDYRENYDREFAKLRCRKSVKDVGSDFEMIALTLYETGMYLDVTKFGHDHWSSSNILSQHSSSTGDL